MFVKYTPKVPHMKVIPLLPTKQSGKGYTFDNDSVVLRPGTNELTDEEWEAIQPHIKDQIDKEIVPFSILVKDGKGGRAKKAKTLKDVPVATARKIIQGCQDPATLKKWFNQELPDELLLVLSKRMRQLKVEPENIEDDDSDLDDDDIIHEDENDSKSKSDTTEEDDDSEEDDNSTEDEDDDTGTGDDSDLDDDDIPDFDGSRNGV